MFRLDQKLLLFCMVFQKCLSNDQREINLVVIVFLCIVTTRKSIKDERMSGPLANQVTAHHYSFFIPTHSVVVLVLITRVFNNKRNLIKAFSFKLF